MLQVVLTLPTGRTGVNHWTETGRILTGPSRTDLQDGSMPTRPIRESTESGTRSRTRLWRTSENPVTSPHGSTTTSRPSVRMRSLPTPSGASLTPRTSAKKSRLTSSERTTSKLGKLHSRSLSTWRMSLRDRRHLNTVGVSVVSRQFSRDTYPLSIPVILRLNQPDL